MPPYTAQNAAPDAEAYPPYDALWPLVSMGVLTPEHAPTGWAYRGTRRTRVAMIDISVAVEHPNLREAINCDLAFDLGSTRLGAFPYRPAQEPLGDLGLAVETKLTDGLPGASALLTELIDRLSRGGTPRIGTVQPATAPEFSGHGTAMAGLIGARPVRAASIGRDGKAGSIPLPFCGVDPYCEIVPISTSFDPDPEELCLALLYADLIRADIVVLARIVPDPMRTDLERGAKTIAGQPPGEIAAPVAPSAERLALWRELAELVVRSSLARPIVCAAGNENEEFSVYPASLADEYNGIISVSAINAKGYPSAFSLGSRATVAGPSSDSEIFNRAEVRLDTRRPDYDPAGVPAQNDNAKFSSFEIISCDVPGDPGYTGSPFRSAGAGDRLRDYGSCFCRFGGTSAASALVTGFISLGISAGEIKADRDGLSAKAWLLSKCHCVEDRNPAVRFPVWSGVPNFPDAQGDAVRGGSVEEYPVGALSD